MARTIVIGDIHACWNELRDLFDRVALADDDVVVSVGDLVDRGPSPLEVVDWFRARPGAVVVCGNHERKHVRRTLSFGQEITRLQFADRYDDAVTWMGTLPYFWESNDAIVVHAALDPGVSVADTPEDVLSGTTSGSERLEKRLGGRWWHELYEGPKPVVFGHHVVGPEPLVRDGLVYGIDTGACHGMRLTALILPTFELVSVAARADHWPETKRRWQVPVLRQRPWPSMTFEQIDRKAADLSRDAEGSAATYLAGVRAWSEHVRAAIPSLAAAADAVIAQLVEAHGEGGFSRAAAAHPAGSILLRRRMGRLSTEHLGCSNADAVFALASHLGVALDVPPAP